MSVLTSGMLGGRAVTAVVVHVARRYDQVPFRALGYRRLCCMAVCSRSFGGQLGGVGLPQPPQLPSLYFC